MMKKPDSHDPTNTATPTHQCPQRPSRRSPNRNRPRNADSRKNENTPSMTSGWPMTPPFARENDAQFVPNWNSIGMPVTTPSVKLIPKSLRPKARDLVVAFIGSRDGQRLDHDDERRQAHRELWEEIVERHREGELQAVR